MKICQKVTDNDECDKAFFNKRDVGQMQVRNKLEDFSQGIPLGTKRNGSSEDARDSAERVRSLNLTRRLIIRRYEDYQITRSFLRIRFIKVVPRVPS